jgi:hypothetical protein
MDGHTALTQLTAQLPRFTLFPPDVASLSTADRSGLLNGSIPLPLGELRVGLLQPLDDADKGFQPLHLTGGNGRDHSYPLEPPPRPGQDSPLPGLDSLIQLSPMAGKTRRRDRVVSDVFILTMPTQSV